MSRTIKKNRTQKLKQYLNIVGIQAVNVVIVWAIELIKTLNMKYLLIIFLIVSCGTRKTDTQQHEDININNTYQEGSKIVLANTFTYTPFDALKPMTIEGKEYVNVRVSNDKSKTYIKWKNRNITKTITITKTKIIERTNHDFLYLGMFTVVALLLYVYFKFKNPLS